MSTLTLAVLATALPAVPDTGSTSLLLGLGILSLGIVAKFIKIRRK